MVRKILVPVDFSPASLGALAHARELARAADAELIIMHALEVPVLPMGDVPYFSLDGLDLLESGERKRLADLVHAQAAAGLRVRGCFHVGPASQTIVEAAKAEQADLIVIGSHGRGALARMFLGSVAERVLRSSPVPVLTVRGAAAPAPAQTTSA